MTRSQRAAGATLVAALVAGLLGARADDARAADPEPAARAPTTVANLAKDLARLRGEVESLATAVEREKDDRRARLRGLADQVSQAEIELRREVLRKDELERRLAEATQALAAKAAAQSGVGPAVETAVARLRAYVAGALPFRRDERLAAVDQVATRVRDGTLGAAQGFARLWELVEDELRLGRESALDRQVVKLPSGEERLVQVLRLGMVTVFYRAGERELGQAVRDGAGWSFRAFTSDADIERLGGLFGSFEKRVRTGFFELPWLAKE